VKLNGKDVVREYAYTAVRSTLFDADLIAWAEHRAAELKRERAARAHDLNRVGV